MYTYYIHPAGKSLLLRLHISLIEEDLLRFWSSYKCGLSEYGNFSLLAVAIYISMCNKTLVTLAAIDNIEIFTLKLIHLSRICLYFT